MKKQFSALGIDVRSGSAADLEKAKTTLLKEAAVSINEDSERVSCLMTEWRELILGHW